MLNGHKQRTETSGASTDSLCIAEDAQEFPSRIAYHCNLTVLDGIPRMDGYVIFTGVVYMMACKCKLNGGTVAPHVCLSWPDLLALPLLNGLRGPCDLAMVYCGLSFNENKRRSIGQEVDPL